MDVKICGATDTPNAPDAVNGVPETERPTCTVPLPTAVTSSVALRLSAAGDNVPRDGFRFVHVGGFIRSRRDCHHNTILIKEANRECDRLANCRVGGRIYCHCPSSLRLPFHNANSAAASASRITGVGPPPPTVTVKVVPGATVKTPRAKPPPPPPVLEPELANATASAP